MSNVSQVIDVFDLQADIFYFVQWIIKAVSWNG